MIARIITVLVILAVGVSLGAKYPSLSPLSKLGL